MEKMTIHRALAELKTIDDRIEKATLSIEPTGIMQQGKPVNGFYQKDDFENKAKAAYQSVVALITRKQKLKSAIVAANAVTIVKIAGKELTIAEAINHKTIIAMSRSLIAALDKKHSTAKAKATTENEKIKSIALENAKIMLGKQGDSKVSPNDDDVKNIMDPFVKRNEFLLVDPLNAEALIEELSKDVQSFVMEVDAALSEINATTLIEV